MSKFVFGAYKDISLCYEQHVIKKTNARVQVIIVFYFILLVYDHSY